MAISNSMATSHVRIVSLPLSKFAFSCLHVRSTGEICYRRLHHHHVAPCSLSSSIQPPLDGGIVQESQVDKLIWEIRAELGSIESRDLRDVETLNDALFLVDLIQRLGVQRHFDHHINGILHSLYREWREESGLASPGITVLAFHLLRLNGFVVSADVIEALKDPNGWFSCFSIQTPRGISDMLNLYKCSQTAFPSESDIMDEANQFARTQLSRALLLEEWDPLLQIDNVRRESVGEMASSISCYMRDNPHCTQDEAITSVRCNIESACREVELEHFKSRALVPECCSLVVLNFARTLCFVYKRADAFSNSSDVEYEMLFRDYYYDPLVHV